MTDAEFFAFADNAVLSDGEHVSRALERDARRYNRAFTEEEEVRLR